MYQHHRRIGERRPDITSTVWNHQILLGFSSWRDLHEQELQLLARGWRRRPEQLFAERTSYAKACAYCSSVWYGASSETNFYSSVNIFSANGQVKPAKTLMVVKEALMALHYLRVRAGPTVSLQNQSGEPVNHPVRRPQAHRSHMQRLHLRRLNPSPKNPLRALRDPGKLQD